MTTMHPDHFSALAIYCWSPFLTWFDSPFPVWFDSPLSTWFDSVFLIHFDSRCTQFSNLIHTIRFPFQSSFRGSHERQIVLYIIQQKIVEILGLFKLLFYFMITMHPDHFDSKCKHSCMTCSACAQLPVDVYWIRDKIDTQILKNPRDLLIHLAAL